MPKHRHRDLIIKAWADGAKVQVKNVSISQAADWLDVNNPSWDTANEYRIKPREFEDGAWYPASLHGLKKVVQYGDKGFSVPYRLSLASLSEFDWIGEKLEIQWPEESE